MKALARLLITLLVLLISLSGCKSNSPDTQSDYSSTNSEIQRPVSLVTYAKTDTVQLDAAKDTFPENTSVKIDTISSGTAHETATLALGELANDFVLYDISAQLNNASIQPSNNVDVTFSVPVEFDLYMTNVVYISDDGALEFISCKINETERTITATLSHFSSYAVINVKSIKAQLKNYILNEYKPGSENTGDCLAFVRTICNGIFKHGIPHLKGILENGKNGWIELATKENKNIVLSQIGETLTFVDGEITEKNLKNLFSKAQPGDFVQMDYTRYKPKKGSYDSRHTMIVYDVSDDGVWLYHRGSSGIYFGRGSNSQPLWGMQKSLDCKPVTWADLKGVLRSDDDGISIFRSTTALCDGNHSYSKATCTEAKTCKRCGNVSGSPLGHDFSGATCTKGGACSRCSEKTDALGHDYSNATCTTPKTCKRCKSTTGSALGHKYSAATCSKLSTCSKCGATKGSLAQHKFSDGFCTACSAPDPSYSNIVPPVFSGTFTTRITDKTQTLNNDDLSEIVLKIKSSADSYGSWGEVIYTGYQLAETQYKEYYNKEYSSLQAFLNDTPDKILHNGKYYVPNVGDGDSITNLTKSSYSISFSCSLLSNKKIDLKYMKKSNNVYLTVTSTDKSITGIVFSN